MPASISIYERVYLPSSRLTAPPGNYTNTFIQSTHGRGFIALQQLLNFSDNDKENSVKSDDFSYVDFPDALSSLVTYACRNYSQSSSYDSNTDFGYGIDNSNKQINKITKRRNSNNNYGLN